MSITEPTQADGLGSESREIRPPSDSIAEERSSSESAAPEPWWKMPLGVGIFGMLAAGFFIFPTVTMGAFFSLSGLLLIGAAVYLCVETLQFVRGALSADGIVVGFEEREDEEQDENERKYSIEIGPISWSFGPKPARRVSFFPRVEFETQDHEKRVFTSDDGSRKPSYRVGQPVRVLYDPAQPQVARINKPLDLWGPIVVAVVFGACFLGPGIRYLLVGFGFLPDDIHWE